MTLFQELRQNPPKLHVVSNPRQVVFTMISAMCDNRSKIFMKKNSDGDFKINCGIHSFSNYQMKFDKDDIEWAADEQRWSDVFTMINSGTAVISEVKSR